MDNLVRMQSRQILRLEALQSFYRLFWREKVSSMMLVDWWVVRASGKLTLSVCLVLVLFS